VYTSSTNRYSALPPSGFLLLPPSLFQLFSQQPVLDFSQPMLFPQYDIPCLSLSLTTHTHTHTHTHTQSYRQNLRLWTGLFLDSLKLAIHTSWPDCHHSKTELTPWIIIFEHLAPTHVNISGSQTYTTIFDFLSWHWMWRLRFCVM